MHMPSKQALILQLLQDLLFTLVEVVAVLISPQFLHHTNLQARTVAYVRTDHSARNQLRSL